MFGFSGNRERIYVQWVRGKYQRRRNFTFAMLHFVLFVTPWLSWHGNPLLLFDLQARRLYAFGAIFTAADTIFLLLLLLFLAFALFFFTSLWGRLWCGFGCPQTVLLDTWVRPLERWIEGERTTRQRRDAGPLSFDKTWRKALKWTLYALAAFVVSMSFMSFFADAHALWTGQAGPVEYTLVAIFTVGWLADFVWFREQFCNYLCPYARFQSALVDEHTLLIAYDPARGEPRGGKTAKADGRCIVCEKCVNVCPQGIDIRNGFQLECIACACCVDACDGVMRKLGHRTLIEYTTTAAQQGRRARHLRPRTIGYAALLCAIAGAASFKLLQRVPFEASVMRMPGTLYTVDPDGFVRNTYLLRVANNAADRAALDFAITIDGLAGASAVVPPLSLTSTESRQVPVIVRVPPAAATQRSLPFQVRIKAAVGERVLHTTFETGGQGADVGA